VEEALTNLINTKRERSHPRCWIGRSLCLILFPFFLDAIEISDSVDDVLEHVGHCSRDLIAFVADVQQDLSQSHLLQNGL